MLNLVLLLKISAIYFWKESKLELNFNPFVIYYHFL